MSNNVGILRISLAWLVHLFTASGIFVAFLALLSIAEGDLNTAMIWIGIALVIDTVDGSLARLVKVKQVLPQFDGHMLDFVTDFLTTVFVPAYFLYQSELIPAVTLLPAVIAIFLASAYHFGNVNAVTKERLFSGYPAFWNIIIFYLYILGLGHHWNLGIIIYAFLMHFIPFRFVYPSQMKHLRRTTLLVVVLTVASSIIVLIQNPTPDIYIYFTSVVGICALFLISTYQTLRDLLKRRSG